MISSKVGEFNHSDFTTTESRGFVALISVIKALSSHKYEDKHEHEYSEEQHGVHTMDTCYHSVCGPAGSDDSISRVH
jgi:hypothetical protein